MRQFSSDAVWARQRATIAWGGATKLTKRDRQTGWWNSWSQEHQGPFPCLLPHKKATWSHVKATWSDFQSLNYHQCSIFVFQMQFCKIISTRTLQGISLIYFEYVGELKIENWTENVNDPHTFNLRLKQMEIITLRHCFPTKFKLSTAGFQLRTVEIPKRSFQFQLHWK